MQGLSKRGFVVAGVTTDDRPRPGEGLTMNCPPCGTRYVVRRSVSPWAGQRVPA